MAAGQRPAGFATFCAATLGVVLPEDDAGRELFAFGDSCCARPSELDEDDNSRRLQQVAPAPVNMFWPTMIRPRVVWPSHTARRTGRKLVAGFSFTAISGFNEDAGCHRWTGNVHFIDGRDGRARSGGSGQVSARPSPFKSSQLNRLGYQPTIGRTPRRSDVSTTLRTERAGFANYEPAPVR